MLDRETTSDQGKVRLLGKNERGEFALTENDIDGKFQHFTKHY